MATVAARVVAAAPSLRCAARAQAGVAAGQIAAGLGNLGFIVAAARVLEPGPFADLAAFAALYLLVHVPVVAATAAGVVDDGRGAPRARAAMAGGVVAGVVALAAAGRVADVLDLPVGIAVSLAAAIPAAVPLGFARGRLYATGDTGGVAATLLAEPVARLLVGVPALLILGPAGGAFGVVVGGYAALGIATRRMPLGTPLPAHAAAIGTSAAPWTAIGFVALALLQNQDLIVARALLDGDAAGRFAVLSAIGGAVAFATATVPFVLLSGARRDGRPALAVALGAAALVGVAATTIAAVVGADLVAIVAGRGDGPPTALVGPYVAAMGALGVSRITVAHLAAKGHRWPVLAALAVAAAHLAVLLVGGRSPGAVVAATSAASGALVVALAAPMVARLPLAVRARLALRDPTVAAVAAATVVALVVRLAVTRGLWVDEAISVGQAKLGLSDLLVDLRSTDVHPPLHHLLLWATVRLVGDGELAVRLPSLVAGAALMPALYDAGRTLYSRRTGMVAAVLGAVAPFAVWYAQEARMYALFMLVATLATTALVRALAEPTLRRWVMWALLAAAAVWTQWFGALIVGVHVVAAAATAWRHRRQSRPDDSRRLAVAVAAGVAVVAVACLPLVDLLGDQLAAYGNRRAGVVAPSTAGAVVGDPAAELSIYALLANGIWAIWGYHADDVMARITALWPLLMLGTLALLGRGRSFSTTLLVAVAAVPGAVLLAAGLVKRDLFELRYFCAAVPAALLLAARALTAMTRRTTTLVAAAGLLTATLVVGLVDQQLNGANPRRYDFEGALARVEERAGPDDVLLYEPTYLGDVIEYYAPELDARPLGRWESSAATGEDVFVLSTRRVADSRGTAARVGHVLKQLEDGGRRVTTRIERPNVDVWELS